MGSREIQEEANALLTQMGGSLYSFLTGVLPAVERIKELDRMHASALAQERAEKAEAAGKRVAALEGELAELKASALMMPHDGASGK